MRALSIKEPWATAIIHGNKDVENRTWRRVDVIGEVIAIHASLTPASDLSRQVFEGLAHCFDEGPHDPSIEAPGCILGTARVVDIMFESKEKGKVDLGLFPWFEGPYGYVLADIEPLDVPIPCRGALGLWEVDANILAKMRGEELATPGEQTRSVCKNRESYTVSVTRGTYKHPNKWGNPHRLKARGDLHRLECLLLHAEHLTESGLIDEVYELRGEVLGCACKPGERCHGHTLARCADADDPRAELAVIIEELEEAKADILSKQFVQQDMFGGGA